MVSMTFSNASARATTALGWLTSSFGNAAEPASLMNAAMIFSRFGIISSSLRPANAYITVSHSATLISPFSKWSR